ncbi:hypothetical protein [Pedobacter jeongneungensis]|uniref:hypothetical protein n=1 Tax=Pedobacter jeongneungensis TaxID=947309 RepID=UPI0004692E14|nr:hypothetical protein [Pedobacter jeongneungensis]
MPKSRNKNANVKQQPKGLEDDLFSAAPNAGQTQDSQLSGNDQQSEIERVGSTDVIEKAPKRGSKAKAKGVKQNPKNISMEVVSETASDTGEQSHIDKVDLQVSPAAISSAVGEPTERGGAAELAPSSGQEGQAENLTGKVGQLAQADFDPSGKVYLEIHKGNIYHYFSKALIAPSVYFDNRAFSDAQSAYQDQLILANSALSTNEDMILLELRLSQPQKESLALRGSIALMDFALPTTHLSAVLVRTEKNKETILNDAALFDGGFIPEQLVQVTPELGVSKIDLSEYAVEKKGPIHLGKLTKFDKILGLLAFLRNYAYLTSGISGTYKTISDHFFLAMQAIDPAFGRTVLSNNSLSEFYGYLFQGDCPPDKVLLKWIFDRIAVGENFNDEDLKNFLSAYVHSGDDSISLVKLKDISMALKDAIKRKTALKLVEQLPSGKSTAILPLYIFAYLRNYAQQNNILISRRDIIGQHSNAYGEYAFALLGYFYGYGSLSNSEERISPVSEPAAISRTAKAKPEIKFKIDQDFDRRVIDVVFDYVFGSERTPQQGVEGIIVEDTHIVNNERKIEIAQKRVSLLDLEYEQIKTKSLIPDFEALINQLSKAAEKISYHSELGFLCQKLGLLPELSPSGSKSMIKGGVFEALKEAFFSKNELIQRLKATPDSIRPEELQIRINLAKENKEL